MRNFVFYLAMLLLLLGGMLPFLPEYLTYIASFLYLVYILMAGISISKAYFRWIVCVLGFFTISALWALTYRLVFFVIIVRLLPIIIASVATYSFLRRSPNNLYRALWVYLLAIGCLVIYLLFNIGDIRSLGEVRMDQVVNENIGIEVDDSRRFNGNAIGMDLCYGLLTGYVLLFKKDKRILRRLILLTITFLVVYLIFMTGSRKAFIMLFIPFIVFPLLKLEKGRILLLPIISGILIIGYYMVLYIPELYNVLGSRVEDAVNIVTGNTTGEEDMSRMLLIEYGLDWFKERPVLGYGINNFRYLSNATSLFLGKNFYAHNNYVELLVGVGIVGLLIYYSCYFYFWKHLRGHFADNELNKWVAVLLIITLVIDFALVSYYDLVHHLIICLCFYAVEITNKQDVGRAKTTKANIGNDECCHEDVHESFVI